MLPQLNDGPGEYELFQRIALQWGKDQSTPYICEKKRLYYICWLVVSTPLKNMKVSWDDYSQYMESHKIPWFQSTNYCSMDNPRAAGTY